MENPRPVHENDGGTPRHHRYQRKRSASRSRSNSRDRKRHHGNNNDQNYRRYSGERDREKDRERESYRHRGREAKDDRDRHSIEPSSTIVVKGLAPHTTEAMLMAVIGPYYPKEIRVVAQKREGDIRILAFVEFISLEYSKYFMSSFAGSAGDANAAQFIVENRCTTIEYARNNSSGSHHHINHTSGQNTSVLKGDWICEACECNNFARRDVCFRCSLPRSERSQSTSAMFLTAMPNTSYVILAYEKFADSLVASDTLGNVLVMKDFSPSLTNMQVAEMFRRFAQVKDVHVLFQPPNFSLAYIEFFSSEHASFVLQQTFSETPTANSLLPMGAKIAFAREKTMHQLLQSSALQNNHLPSIGTNHLLMPPQQQQLLAQKAMQAAQWNINNGYAANLNQLAPAATQSVTSEPPVAALPAMTTIQPMMDIWPPSFETNGGLYVFQAKSGYFLEPRSEFYYCPKAKLYYRAKDGVYFRFEAQSEQPFQVFIPPLPTEPYVAVTSVNNGENNNEQRTNYQNEEEQKNETTSSLPAAPLKLSLNKINSNNASKIAGLGQKKALKDIAKWGALQREDDDEDENKVDKNSANNKVKSPDVTSLPVTAVGITAENKIETVVVAAGTVATAAAAASSINPTTTSTTTGTSSNNGVSHVCLLCRRQFTSSEMLSRHEKESKLHADNLAKQQLQQKGDKKDVPQYRDRAEERRILYGSEADHKAPMLHNPLDIDLLNRSASTALPVSDTLLLGEVRSDMSHATSSTIAASIAEDMHNPGNMLLRTKFGWTDGQGLGKDNSGRAEAVGVELAAQQAQTQPVSAMHATLRTTLAPGNNNAGHSLSNNLRQQNMQAARARFEELQK